VHARDVRRSNRDLAAVYPVQYNQGQPCDEGEALAQAITLTAYCRATVALTAGTNTSRTNP